MPQLDIVEQAFIAAAPGLVAAWVRGGAPARELWPGLELRVSEDRGLEGQRYLVIGTSQAAGGLRGTAEIWLAQVVDGVVAHVFLRADPTPPDAWSPRRARRHQARWRRHIRQVLWEVKDALESGRPPGAAVVAAMPG